MYCPMCGHELVRRDRTEELRKAEAAYQDAMNAWIDADWEGDPPDESKDESGHLECQNSDCNLGGTYFNLHHPFHDVGSRRGDSFSLSWVK